MSAEKIAAALAAHQWRGWRNEYFGDGEWRRNFQVCACGSDWSFAHLAAMLEPVIREAQAEALERAADVTPLGRGCPSCGAKPGYACYGNGPMRYPHQDRGLTRSYLRARAAGIREGEQ